MTVRLLDVTPRDVAAGALGLLLDAPVPAALAELTLRDGSGGELGLYVLAASHAVLATRPGHRLTEQVSCAVGGRPLPPRFERAGYTLAARTSTLPPAELAALAADLRGQGEGWLCGAFPGHPDALTALHGTADGLLVVQSGSPYSTPTAFWRTVSTVGSAGLAVTPYHVHVPSFGDWGFTLARSGPAAPVPSLSPAAAPLRFLDAPTLAAATVFPRDRPRLDLEPSTLDRPRIVDDLRLGYTR